MTTTAAIRTCAAALAIATASLAHAADPVTLKVGNGEQYESLQPALDAAPDGAVIRLAAGDFTGPVRIEKPVRIEGAGWDKTRLVIPQSPSEDFDKAIKELEETVRSNKSEAEAAQVIRDLVRKYRRDGLTIKSARNVELHDLRIVGAPADRRGPASLPSLVTLSGAAQAKFENCAVLGALGNGITSTEGSDLEVRHCLVGGLWGTGIAAYYAAPAAGHGGGRLVVADSDVRNCYYACVTFGLADGAVERSRITGAAWHGIRLGPPEGGATPRIEGNRFWHIARCGIYTDGTAGAMIRDNLFDGIEMGGVCCWPGNRDTIERNTFVNNKREGASAAGDSHPTLRNNVFANNATAITASKVNGNRPADQVLADPKLDGNWFWQNAADFQHAGADKPVPLPDDTHSTHADPGFADPANGDYTLTGPAKDKAGAAHPLPASSPFPLTEEERRIIPQGDTYDYRSWRNRPEGMR